MLALLPIFLLLAGALAVLVWHRLRPGFGVPWLICTAASLLVWVFLLVISFRMPIPLAFNTWRALGEAADFPSFLLDSTSWVYLFSLTGLLLAVLLTASARLIHQSNPYTWAACLAIVAMGMLSVLSANPLTLAAAWSAIDLVELVTMLALLRQNEWIRQVIVAFAIRITGTLLLLGAILQARSLGVVLNFSQVPPEVSLPLLLAAGLRLGVLPLNLPFLREVITRRGVGVVLRLVPAASSLVLLARLPAGAFPADWMPVLTALTLVAVAYGALMWMTARNELDGRPYLMISLAGFAVGSALRGRPDAGLAWGAALILSGGLLVLYSARGRQVLVFPLLGLLGLTGIPFTPAASGWSGLWSLPPNLPDVVFILAHVLLLIGYLRHSLAPADDLNGMERWIQGIYPVGLFTLVVTFWAAAHLHLPGTRVLLPALPGVISTLLALGLTALLSRSRRASPGWLTVIIRQIAARLAAFFRLDWFYRLFWIAYDLGRRLVGFLTVILEGEGGVLWALLLLILVVSLLISGGAQ